jgi:hypothetical protein
VVAFGIQASMASEPPCPHCGGEFQVAKADSTRYLLCAGCGLVHVLPFAAFNPGSSLLGPVPRSTAV